MHHNINKPRLAGPDIIRTVAILCVIAGHFYAVNTPYNQAQFEGTSMFFQGWLKSITDNIGVPFFIMLTGFLNTRKTLSKDYYKGIKRVLVPYLVISIITWVVLSVDHSVTKLMLGILGFKMVGYAWYVEMYIGLFLLIPFLNMVIRQVFDNGQAKYLLLTALFQTALPPLLNRGNVHLVPGFWMMTFPLTFYIIAAAIREYQPHLKRKFLWFIGALLIYGIAPVSRYATLRLGGVDFSFSASYYSLVNTAATVIVFLLLYDINEVPTWIKKACTFVASIAFEMFLWSYMFDKLVYPFVMERYYVSQPEFIIWFVPIVASVFVLSMVTAYIYKRLSDLLDYAKYKYKTNRIR